MYEGQQLLQTVSLTPVPLFNPSYIIDIYKAKPASLRKRYRVHSQGQLSSTAFPVIL